MSDTHVNILESYFFAFVDEGAAPEETPLFTGKLNEKPLVEVVSQTFGLDQEEAAEALDLARKEVEL